MKNNYVVRVLDLPEHERVILKLIFSVSEKSKLRSNTYTLADTLHEPADVVIRDGQVACAPALDVQRELRVVDAQAIGIDAPVILRPLIATRVLAVLDDVFAAAVVVPQALMANDCANTQERAPTPAGPSVVVALACAQADVAHAAIVDSMAREHPANLEPPGIPASQGAEVAAVIDTALLSTALKGLRLDILEAPSDTPENTGVAAVNARLKPRVLVVDDNAVVCKQLEIELLQFDVEVDYVPSARKAIEMVGKYSYQVALLEVVLPDWDGYRICKHIKSKAPATFVVMLADKTTASDKLRGALAGCNAYLVKPMTRQTFQTTVKNHLPLAASRQALDAV